MRCSKVSLLVLALLISGPVHAHRSFFNATVTAGSGSLAGQALSGQVGFSESSPFYIYGEASHDAFYLAPDDNSYRGLGEIGYESVHLGVSIRGGYMSGPFESVTFNQLGATLFYRFVRWGLLSADEELYLNKRQQEELRQQHLRETNADLPKAPLLGIGYDQFSVSSSLSQVTAINPVRLSAFLRATLEPFWTFVPSISFYEYVTPPTADPAGYRSYTSRALRLVRLGPQGPYSGIFGMPDNTQQVYSEVKLFPQLRLDGAITRVSLDAPSFDAYSFWIGADRFFGGDRKWAVSPSFELVILEGVTNAFVSIAVKYGAASTYLPPFEK
jgi:hypothetical protein